MPLVNESASLSVKIVSPEKVLFQGPANAVSSQNEEGPFSIMSGHAGFISLISGDVCVYPSIMDSSKLVFSIKRAVLHCKDNTVKIMIGVF